MVVVANPISFAVSMATRSLSCAVTLATPTLSNIKKSAGLPITCNTSLPKARPKPNTTHMTLTTPMTIKLCNIVDMTFLALTIPP